ncbi:MAG: flagellar hook-basal body protein [Lachnospiraceae bacterium]|nr:flagellar hook-basal body protein [Lachnospiraceae bacterium]
MVKGLYTAYSGMINEQHRMDTMTNNLANVATTGFKKEGATSQSFRDALAVEIKDKSEYYLTKRMGIMNPGVKIGENYTDYSEGGFRETNNTYDLALSDRGFFMVEFTNKAGETSTKYTRDGSFTLTLNGDLVTKDGDFVLDNNGNHIHLSTTAETQIDRQGGIYQNGNLVATVGVTDFEDPNPFPTYDYLEKYGENYFEPVEGAVQTASPAQVISGYLEQSNVNQVEEMVNMIAINRQYEANQKIITAIDGTLDIAVNNLMRPK